MKIVLIIKERLQVKLYSPSRIGLFIPIMLLILLQSISANAQHQKVYDYNTYLSILSEEEAESFKNTVDGVVPTLAIDPEDNRVVHFGGKIDGNNSRVILNHWSQIELIENSFPAALSSCEVIIFNWDGMEPGVLIKSEKDLSELKTVVIRTYRDLNVGIIKDYFTELFIEFEEIIIIYQKLELPR